MDKYGAVRCPKCGSFKTSDAGDVIITVQHPELVKEASANPGGRFKCLDCNHVFEKVTSSRASTGDSAS